MIRSRQRWSLKRHCQHLRSKIKTRWHWNLTFKRRQLT